jgi:hypothetical protein
MSLCVLPAQGRCEPLASCHAVVWCGAACTAACRSQSGFPCGSAQCITRCGSLTAGNTRVSPDIIEGDPGPFRGRPGASANGPPRLQRIANARPYDRSWGRQRSRQRHASRPVLPTYLLVITPLLHDWLPTNDATPQLVGLLPRGCAKVPNQNVLQPVGAITSSKRFGGGAISS